LQIGFVSTGNRASAETATRNAEIIFVTQVETPTAAIPVERYATILSITGNTAEAHVFSTNRVETVYATTNNVLSIGAVVALTDRTRVAGTVTEIEVVAATAFRTALTATDSGDRLLASGTGRGPSIATVARVMGLGAGTTAVPGTPGTPAVTEPYTLATIRTKVNAAADALKVALELVPNQGALALLLDAIVDDIDDEFLEDTRNDSNILDGDTIDDVDDFMDYLHAALAGAALPQGLMTTAPLIDDALVAVFNIDGVIALIRDDLPASPAAIRTAFDNYITALKTDEGDPRVTTPAVEAVPGTPAEAGVWAAPAIIPGTVGGANHATIAGRITDYRPNNMTIETDEGEVIVYFGTSSERTFRTLFINRREGTDGDAFSNANPATWAAHGRIATANGNTTRGFGSHESTRPEHLKGDNQMWTVVNVIDGNVVAGTMIVAGVNSDFQRANELSYY
jgi:hypothetical protein